MKKMIVLLSLLCAVAFSGQAMAEEGKGSVGFGTYTATVKPKDTTVYSEINLFGTALNADYGITDLVSVSGHFYSVKDTVFIDFGVAGVFGSMDVETSGYDVLLRAGKSDLGFTYFGGVGYFSETTDFRVYATGFGLTVVTTDSSDDSGLFLAYGLGYNWDRVAVTWEGGIRSSSDYGSEIDSVSTGALNVSYRF